SMQACLRILRCSVLGALFLIFAGLCQAQIEIANTAFSKRGAQQSGYAIGNFNPGTGADKLVVSVSSEGEGGTRSVNQITFGGEQLTRATFGNHSSATNRRNEVWYLDDPGSSIGNVTVNFSGTTNGCLIGVYSLRNTQSGPPALIDTQDGVDGVSLSVTQETFVLAALVANDEGAVTTPGDYDALASGEMRSSRGAVASTIITSAVTNPSFATNGGTPVVTAVGIQSETSVVTTATDELDTPSGNDLSLREAIRDAAAGDIILFDPSLDGQTIPLDATLGQLVIDKSLTIDASALPTGIIIDGGSNGDFILDEGETRCFTVNSGTVTFRNLTIQNGVSEGANILNNAVLTLVDCKILGGRAFSETGNASGGGIFCQDGALTLTRCTVSGNETSGENSDGGGIAGDRVTLTFTDSTISQNQTHGDNSEGGGIYVTTTGGLTMTGCTISGNQTHGTGSIGAGIFSTYSNNANITTLTRCTIVGNTALNAVGGGIANPRGNLSLSHCTLVDNSAANGEGAGIASSTDAPTTETTIQHSIIRNDAAASDLSLIQGSRDGNSFIFSGENIIGSAGVGINNATTNTAPILLATLGDYGGPTQTMPPLAGSPAIDAATGSTNFVDQRGFTTIGIPDIGAAEFNSITVTTLSDELDDTATDGDGISLREALRDAGTETVITFAPDLDETTIFLTSGQIVIDKSVTIDASALPNGITIDGGSNGDLVRNNGETRCFFISDGVNGSRLNVILENLTIQNGVSANQTKSGGNIFSDENLTLIRCRILDGRALNFGFGGGISHQIGALTLQDCTVAGNLASTTGGGIDARGESLIVTGCTVAENTSQTGSSGGGGITSSTDFAHFTRCTITKNSAPAGAGITFVSGNTVIEHCTIVGNTLTRSFVNNTRLNGAGIGAESGSTVEIAHSIIRDNLGGPDIGETDLNIVTQNITYTGSNIIGTLDDDAPPTTLNTDPILLGALANNGGPTKTMLPLFGSPAIDAATSSDTTTDQRSLPITGFPDIGAAESSFFIVSTTTDERDTPASNGTGISLREAIRDAAAGDVIVFNESLDGKIIQLDAQKGALRINKSLSIDASALPNGITIDGGSNGDFVRDSNETRCFLVDDGDNINFVDVSFNNLTIQNGVFEGAFAGGNIHSTENLTLTNCQILDGRAFSNVVNTNNEAGAGIYHQEANLTMIACTVSGNQTQGDGSQGGGIYNEAGSLMMTACTVSDNKTLGPRSQGGGIHSSRGSLIMTACTISDNQTEGDDSDGGGINSLLQTTRLTRCTITGNSAQNADGGGIFNERGQTIIEHCTIVENSTGSGNGAGIASDDDNNTQTEISHSIVQDNSGGRDLALDGSGNVNSFQFSGENLIGTVGANIGNAPDLNTAPILLGALANNGGLTQTMLPQSGSPAIDAAISSMEGEDQRGFPIFGIPDIGAAEFQGEDDAFSDTDADGLTRI
ncbi:right-handed parallel beta-helix repeat-containing protein, partial [bacterium]|nr:right-handed parallel beta-helix repeat-containing protein [bacterium]